MLDQFYRAVLPEQGHFALFAPRNKQHTWCSSLDALTCETEKRIDEPNLYFATSAFAAPTERTIANALSRRAFCFDIDAGAEKFAKHGDKVYETQNAAIAAVMAWAKTSKIRPAWVLSSGAGLHVYILLDADAPIAQWTPTAKALKAMALVQGLRIDPTVTADAARVLRPPGTLHHSGARVAVLARGVKAYSLLELASLTAEFAPRPPVREKSANSIFLEPPVGPPRVLAKVTQHCAAMAHAVSHKGDVSEPYWRAMLGVIKFTVDGDAAAQAASEGHPDYDYDSTQRKYDAWTAGPSTCTLFEGENPQACAGCAHRGKIKSPIVLGELNDREVAAQPAPAPAPFLPTLPDEPAEFSAFSSADDEAPLAVEAALWDEYMPDGFRVVVTPGQGHVMVGKVSVKVPDETAPKDAKAEKTIWVDREFAAVPFWFESWAAGSHDGDQALATYCVYNRARHTVTRYTLPTKLVAQRDALLGALASQNVQVYPSTNGNKQLMEDFVKASLERIRSAGQRQKILERFGAIFSDQDVLMVAQGRHLIQADGTITEGVVQEKLKTRSQAYRVPLPDNMAGRWEKDVWASHIKPRAQAHIAYLDEFYAGENFRPYQLAIMLAWASPMLAFMQGTYLPGAPLPGIGLTVSLYSPLSGIGKTACMHAAALAFGVPSAVVLQLDRLNSTDFARQMLLLQCGTIPSFMDEMEDLEARDLASLISTVGNGSSRNRIDGKTMQLTGGITTSVLNLMSTNKSHRELAAADRTESSATQMRLLEIDCSHVRPVDQDIAHRETMARAALQDSAGAVGAMLHYAMCRMGYESLNKLGLLMANRARTHMEGRQDGRFMWRALGAMLAVRQILAALGLAVFSDEELIREFRIWHDAGYAFAEDRLMPSDGVSLMSMCLSDLASKTLVTLEEADMRSVNARYDPPLNDRFPDEVVARSVLRSRIVYIRADAVRDWAFKKRVSFRNIMDKCKEEGVFILSEDKRRGHLMQRDLFKGTKMSQGVRSSVLKVDLQRISGAETEYEKQIMNNVRELRAKGT